MIQHFASFPMARATEDDALDARVVEDAFAFIDAFYGSPSDCHTTDADEDSLSENDTCDLETQQLRIVLNDLHTKLMAMNEETGMTQLTSIRSAQVDETSEIHQILDECQRVWYHVMGVTTARHFYVLKDTNIANFLRRRLDEIVGCVTNGMSERPLIEQRAPVDEVSDKYFDHPHHGAAIRFRSGRHIPFKLSILVRATWSVLIESTFNVAGRSHVLTKHFEESNEILARYRDDPDGTEGVTILRRTFLPDGSMLICWTGVAAAPHAEIYHPCNSIGDAETHQFGWVRVGRCWDETSQHQRVYLESISDVVVRPSTSSIDHPETNLRLFERFMTSMYAWKTKHGGKGRQQIENRMLEATLQTSPDLARHRST